MRTRTAILALPYPITQDTDRRVAKKRVEMSRNSSDPFVAQILQHPEGGMHRAYQIGPLQKGISNCSAKRIALAAWLPAMAGPRLVGK